MNVPFPPAAPLPGETCPGQSTWDASPPHRPGAADWNGNSLQNANSPGVPPPNPGTHPTAALLNAMMLQLSAYGRVVPNARLSVIANGAPSFAFVTGVPTWVASLGSSAFLITRNGAGDYSLTWGAPTGTGTWAPATAYNFGYILPPIPTGFFYAVNTRGTSGATPPTWPTILGSLVNDGSVTWVCAGYINTLPPPVSQPEVTLNLPSGIPAGYMCCASVVNITSGVRVTTSQSTAANTASFALTDMNFSVTIY